MEEDQTAGHVPEGVLTIYSPRKYTRRGQERISAVSGSRSSSYDLSRPHDDSFGRFEADAPAQGTRSVLR